MNITIKSTNMELTPAIQDYAEKRISKGIVKYATEAATVAVIVAKTTNHHKHGDVFMAEASVITPLGKTHHAVSEKSDLYEAIDDLRDILVRELSFAKDKKDTLWKRGARSIKKLVRRS
jgi:ribosomal subunit interface protein